MTAVSATTLVGFPRARLGKVLHIPGGGVMEITNEWTLIRLARGAPSASGRPTVVMTWKVPSKGINHGDFLGGGPFEYDSAFELEQTFLVPLDEDAFLDLLDELSVAETTADVRVLLNSSNCRLVQR